MSQAHTYETALSARRLLNRIRGHAGLYMSGLVEEFILPFVMDPTRAGRRGEIPRTRATLELVVSKVAPALC